MLSFLKNIFGGRGAESATELMRRSMMLTKERNRKQLAVLYHLHEEHVRRVEMAGGSVVVDETEVATPPPPAWSSDDDEGTSFDFAPPAPSVNTPTSARPSDDGKKSTGFDDFW